MKKLYVLCLATLVAIFLDIVFFHSQEVSAQNTQIHIQRVEASSRGSLDGSVNAVSGTVVGFSCTSNSDGFGQCYLAVSR